MLLGIEEIVGSRSPAGVRPRYPTRGPAVDGTFTEEQEYKTWYRLKIFMQAYQKFLWDIYRCLRSYANL